MGVTEWGGPDVLQVLDLPTPQAGPGQVRIRVYAAAVNPTDTLLRDGSRADALRDVPPPFVPGMDAAGVLDQIGPGVQTSLQVGDPVMAIVLPAGAHGAYAEQIVVPAESVVRAPQGASHAEAASLLMNAVTVRAALDALDLQPGQLLAVTGAAGAVGGFAVELAKADGLRVVADASPADEKLVTSLGADVVVPRGDDFGARVREVFPDGADGLVDGALLDEHALPASATAGGSPPSAATRARMTTSAASPSTRCSSATMPASRPCSTAFASRPNRVRSPCAWPRSCRPARPRKRTASSKRAVPAAA